MYILKIDKGVKGMVGKRRLRRGAQQYLFTADSGVSAEPQMDRSHRHNRRHCDWLLLITLRRGTRHM